jgi:beta-lactam-binding protein with PASTA domain
MLLPIGFRSQQVQDFLVRGLRLSVARRAIPLFLAITTLASSCASKVVVPDVRTKDVDQAKKTLEAVPLKTGKLTGISGDLPPGAYIVTQTPKPGEQVSANSTVDLVVEAPVTVPDLQNSAVTEAVNVLQGLGLKVTLVKQSSPNVFKSTKIVQQSPPAFTPVHRDSIVVLTVSAPPNVADLIGLITKEGGYDKLNPQNRGIVDDFVK